jgi:hypothetical protein
MSETIGQMQQTEQAAVLRTYSSPCFSKKIVDNYGLRGLSRLRLAIALVSTTRKMKAEGYSLGRDEEWDPPRLWVQEEYIANMKPQIGPNKELFQQGLTPGS